MKLKLLFIAFFLSVWGMTQVKAEVTTPVDGQYYTITCADANRGGLVYDEANSIQWIWSTKKSMTAGISEDCKYWAFLTADNGERYLYNAVAKKFAAPMPGGTYGTSWGLSETPAAITLVENGWSAGNFTISSGSTYMSISTNYNGPIISWYSANDGGVPMTIAAVEGKLPDAALVADLKAKIALPSALSGAKTILEKVGYVGGLDPTDADVLALQTVYNNGSGTDAAAINAAVAALSGKTPLAFKYGKKYALKNVANPTLYLEYTTTTQGTIDTPHLTNTGKTSSTYDASSNNYSFSFYRQGDNVYMYNVGSKTFVSTYGSDAWSLSTTPTAMTVSPITSANYAFKFVSGGEYTHMHINNGSNYATGTVTWTSGSNASQWNLIEVGDVDAADLATITSYAEFGTNMTTAAALIAKENSVGGYTTAQLADLKLIYNDGNCTVDKGADLAAAIASVKSNAAIAMDFNKVYKLKNAKSGVYLKTYKTDGNVISNTGKAGAETDADAVWGFFKSKNTQALYMYNDSTKMFVNEYDDQVQWNLGKALVPVTLTDSVVSGAYNIRIKGSESELSYIHVNNGDQYPTGVVGWEASSPASQWYLIPAGDIDQTFADSISTLVDGYKGYGNITSLGTAITDLANLADGQTVALYNAGRSLYIKEKTDGKVWMGATSYVPEVGVADAKDYVWTVNKTSDGTYTFKANSGKYMPTIAASTQPTLGSTAGEFVITSDGSMDLTKSTSADGGFYIRNNNATAMYFNGNPAGQSFVGWSAAGGNSKYNIIPVTLEEVSLFDITYICKDAKGDTLNTFKESAQYGDTCNFATPPAIDMYKFVSSSDTLPSYVVDSYKTVVFNYVRVKTLITSLDEISPLKAYQIVNTVGDRGAMFCVDSVDYVLSSKGKISVALNDTTDNFLWSIYKSEETGNYYLYNLAASKFVSVTEANEFAPISTLGLVPLKIDTCNVANAWVISTKADDYQIAVSNNYNYGIITNWNDATDAGNQQTFYEMGTRTLTQAEIDIVAARVLMLEKYADAMAEAKAIIANFDKVGGYNSQEPVCKELVRVYADGACTDGILLVKSINDVKALAPVSVDGVQAETGNKAETEYDMQGRVLSKSAKGIRIINGKKYIR